MRLLAPRSLHQHHQAHAAVGVHLRLLCANTKRARGSDSAAGGCIVSPGAQVVQEVPVEKSTALSCVSPILEYWTILASLDVPQLHHEYIGAGMKGSLWTEALLRVEEEMRVARLRAHCFPHIY